MRVPSGDHNRLGAARERNHRRAHPFTIGANHADAPTAGIEHHRPIRRPGHRRDPGPPGVLDKARVRPPALHGRDPLGIGSVRRDGVERHLGPLRLGERQPLPIRRPYGRANHVQGQLPRITTIHSDSVEYMSGSVGRPGWTSPGDVGQVLPIGRPLRLTHDRPRQFPHLAAVRRHDVEAELRFPVLRRRGIQAQPQPLLSPRKVNGVVVLGEKRQTFAVGRPDRCSAERHGLTLICSLPPHRNFMQHAARSDREPDRVRRAGLHVRLVLRHAGRRGHGSLASLSVTYRVGHPRPLRRQVGGGHAHTLEPPQPEPSIRRIFRPVDGLSRRYFDNGRQQRPVRRQAEVPRATDKQQLRRSPLRLDPQGVRAGHPSQRGPRLLAFRTYRRRIHRRGPARRTTKNPCLVFWPARRLNIVVSALRNVVPARRNAEGDHKQHRHEMPVPPSRNPGNQ